jgi:hypothetical protein
MNKECCIQILFSISPEQDREEFRVLRNLIDFELINNGDFLCLKFGFEGGSNSFKEVNTATSI